MTASLLLTVAAGGCATSQAAPVTASGPRPFRPAWWCRGANQQTVLGALFRPVPPVKLERQRWETPDGDFIDVDWLSGPPGAPILIVLHGLEGSSRSKYVVSLLAAAEKEGWGGLGVNYRSCSGELNRLLRSYHGGETSDLTWIVQKISAENGGSPIFLAGASLGANILLKYLGEQGEGLPAAVRAGVAISTPFDLARSAHTLEHGFARVYMKGIVKSMKGKARAKLKTHPGFVDEKKLEAAQTLAEFDDLVTAPVHGFRDANDYWSHSSSIHFLAGIRRPALLISAKDDPFFPGAYLPVSEVAANRFLTAEFTANGGHVGFLTGFWPGHLGSWTEQRTILFLKDRLQRK
ncbi:MAG: alpha/beta fold hydrolase [Candidatus Omnitrophica bacterium]|nr:alpha/beta fold hydrolase [Candidatus Omnitrophota bacterium]